MKKKIINLLIINLGFLLLSGTSVHAATKVGTVVVAIGTTDVIRENGASVLPLQKKSPVYLNDRIKTGSGSQVKLLLNDNSILKIGPSSELVIDELFVGSSNQSQTSIKLLNGRVRSLVGKKLGKKSYYRIHTPVAVAGVRGTDFEVWAGPNKESAVRCFEGSVVVSKGLSKRFTGVVLTPNTYTVVTKNISPIKPKTISPGENLLNAIGEVTSAENESSSDELDKLESDALEDTLDSTSSLNNDTSQLENNVNASSMTNVSSSEGNHADESADANSSDSQQELTSASDSQADMASSDEPQADLTVSTESQLDLTSSTDTQLDLTNTNDAFNTDNSSLTTIGETLVEPGQQGISMPIEISIPSHITDPVLTDIKPSQTTLPIEIVIPNL